MSMKARLDKIARKALIVTVWVPLMYLFGAIVIVVDVIGAVCKMIRLNASMVVA
ncbi:MAG: hypothetical protein ACOH18_02105 [Candidatus Saccharimonadaceae bacterium]